MSDELTNEQIRDYLARICAALVMSEARNAATKQMLLRQLVVIGDGNEAIQGIIDLDQAFLKNLNRLLFDVSGNQDVESYISDIVS